MSALQSESSFWSSSLKEANKVRGNILGTIVGLGISVPAAYFAFRPFLKSWAGSEFDDDRKWIDHYNSTHPDDRLEYPYTMEEYLNDPFLWALIIAGLVVAALMFTYACSMNADCINPQESMSSNTSGNTI